MDGKFQDNKSWVHFYKNMANQAGEALKQLESKIKEEGWFYVELCIVISMSTINCEHFIVKNLYIVAGTKIKHN